VDGISQGIKDSSDMIRDVRMDGPKVFFRERYELGETAIAIDAQDVDTLADVRLPGSAVGACPATDMSLGTYSLTDFCPLDIGSHRHDLTAEFVADGGTDLHATAAPPIPFINMAVCPADAGMSDGYQDVSG
jgi:hypothetical protein